jgi:hypothetical protein
VSEPLAAKVGLGLNAQHGALVYQPSSITVT